MRNNTQGKGAVGRFFSELTRNTAAAAAAADGGGGYSSSPSPGGRLSAAAAAAVASAGGGGGSSAAGLDTHSSAAAAMTRQGSGAGGPLAAARLLPSSLAFDPATYLAVFHGGSSASQLAAGVRSLERQLGESTGQLKQLVRVLDVACHSLCVMMSPWARLA
jgi:hypothetical protein